MVKESSCKAGDEGRQEFNPWVGKIPWRRAWKHTPVFLPGESHGERGAWWVQSIVLQRVGREGRNLARTHTSFHVVIFVVQSLSHVWLYDSMDCGPPGSSVHEILQVRILEWVVTSFSWGSSWSRNRTQVSCIADLFIVPDDSFIITDHCFKRSICK